MSLDLDRNRLLDDLRAWLNGLDDADLDAVAATDDAPDIPDLFTLFSELAALKNEVKLESRQIKGALEQFRELFDALQQANAQLRAELAEQRRREQTGIAEAERALLLELIDLRDRLLPGQAHAAGYRPGWLARRGGAKAFVEHMADGMAMNLRRLDESLARRNVHPITSIGQPFDPLVMRAVDTVEDPAQPANRVVDETRTGYLRGDRLLRLAEVIVNKHAMD